MLEEDIKKWRKKTETTPKKHDMKQDPEQVIRRVRRNRARREAIPIQVELLRGDGKESRSSRGSDRTGSLLWT